MQTSLFDFDLPPEAIALRPAVPRGASRLLVVQADGKFQHCQFSDLPDLLKGGDILCLNDSRVIPARLQGWRPGRRVGDVSVSVQITLHQRRSGERFSAFVQPARRLREGDVLDLGEGLTAHVLDRAGGSVELAFNQTDAALDAAIAHVGSMPLPPYIAKKRPADKRDAIDYQTVYARHDGSVAAPTAGLHFTPEMLKHLSRHGVSTASVTLHVGGGTFLPVGTEDTSLHRMHSENIVVEAAAAEALNGTRRAGGRIVAVGTTALRTLESAASPDGILHPMSGDTDIFITPGYRFRAVDVLMTNFHLPRSTLFILVSAFMGLDVMQAAYAEAIRQKYRFYSYGDACLLFRPT